MTDYIYKVGNYNTHMIQSGFTQEGYFDLYNMSAEELAENSTLAERRKSCGITNGTKKRWEFAFSPCIDFLASADPLVNDTELKLRFDRAPGNLAFLQSGAVTDVLGDDAIAIKDCVAITEYVSSPQMRDYFSTIENSPIVYEYEETDILIKNIPMNEKEIRF